MPEQEKVELYTLAIVCASLLSGNSHLRDEHLVGNARTVAWKIMGVKPNKKQRDQGEEE